MCVKYFFPPAFGRTMAIAEVLSSSYIVALVPKEDSEPVWKRSRFYLWDNSHSEMLDTVELPSPILSLTTRSEYILAATATAVYLYSTDLGQVLHTYTVHPTTAAAAPPFVAMTSEPTPFLAAFPGSEKSRLSLCTLKDDDSDEGIGIGELAARAITEERPSFAAFSRDGSLLAVAALGGTRIAVYDTASGRLVASFRRGRSPTTITAAAFSEDKTMLAVASIHGTVHIFGLPGDEAKGKKGSAETVSSAMLPCPQTMVTLAFVEEEISRLVVIGSDGSWTVYGLSLGKDKILAKIEHRCDTLDLN